VNRLQAHITIGRYSFTYAAEVVIRTSREDLTDTCEIKIPRTAKLKSDNMAVGVDSLFRRGDRVEVSIGYHPNIFKRFTGFISMVSPEQITTIKCEDAYNLKQQSLNLSFKSVSLADLVASITDMETMVADAQLGTFRIKNATAAQVLEELKNTYGLYSWIEDEVLHVGLAYEDLNHGAVKFAVGTNVVRNSLTYRQEEDTRVGAKAISILPNNQKIEVVVGDTGGYMQTLYFVGLEKGELKARAEEKLKELKFDGYEGSFEAFGSPLINHSRVVEFIDPNLPERNGKYYVRSVEVQYGDNGYRQTVELDRRAGA
jgi:hypothetical protein